MSVHEVAGFMRAHEPFSQLAAAELERLAAAVEIEYFARGSVVFEQGAEPLDHVHMIRRGSVELSSGGRLLDLLEEGELFGHPSMLAGVAAALTARAHEDTLCYRLPAEQLLPLLARPEGLRFVARTLLERPRVAPAAQDAAFDPALRPIAAYVRDPVVLAQPSDSVRDVATQMAEQGVSCALVALGDGRLGIFTDQDIRVRVVARGADPATEVAQVMTAPAITVRPERPAIDVLVEMIDRGVRHLPVLSREGRVLGVVDDVDLLAADTRSPFMLRRAIARAQTVDELVDAAIELPPAIVALHDAGVAAAHVCSIITAVADALTRRAIALLGAGRGLPALDWLAMGSLGRREAFPSSDLDSALIWDGDAPAEEVLAFAGEVVAVLERCGFAEDPNGVTATDPLFSRSSASLAEAIGRWLDRPEDSRLLVALSVLADGRPLAAGSPSLARAYAPLRDARRHPVFLSRVRRMALAHRPPTGFLRDFVVESSGERRGRLDIKRGGLAPIVDAARYFGLVTGTDDTSTQGRLRAAADAGELDAADATTLQEAFELLCDLRMRHQVAQLRDGAEPDDFVDPQALNPLMRSYLREAFRAIARTQRRLPGRL